MAKPKKVKTIDPHHSDAILFEYSKITPQISIGTNQCCVTHFRQELIKKGLRADVSLEEKKIDAPFGAQYYLWMPVKDHNPPTFKQFEVGTRFLDRLTTSGEKIYVHCQHGHGRAPTLVAAYFALYKGMSVKKAVEFIKGKRPNIHPNRKQITAAEQFVKKSNLKKLII